MITEQFLTRGAKSATMVQAVCDLFLREACKPLVEYQLPNGQRLDVATVNARRQIVGVEVKSTVSDFNRDLKWTQYQQFCVLFYFAVEVGFDLDKIPSGVGIILVNGSHARWYARSRHPCISAGKHILWGEKRGALGLPPHIHRKWWKP